MSAPRTPAASRTKSAPTPRQKPGSGRGRTTGPRRRRTVALLVVLVVLSVAAAALAVTAVVLDRRGAALDAARDEGRRSAETAAEVVLGYGYQTFDADVAAARAAITGDFAAEYDETNGDALRDLTVQTQAVVEADVLSSGVVSSSADEVVVLVFVDQTTTSTTLTEPRVDQTRLRMTMSLVDGQWLVSGLESL